MTHAQRGARSIGANPLTLVVLLFAAAMVALGAATVLARLATPWDGTSVMLGAEALGDDPGRGIPIQVRGVTALQDGDRVVAVDGVAIENLGRGPFGLGPSPSEGLSYQVVSPAGGERIITPELMTFPAGLLLEDAAGFATIGALLLIGLYVVRMRPRDPAARLMIVIGAAFLPGVLWRWIGVSDLVGGPVLPIAVLYMPIYFLGITAFAAMVAVFPRPSPWALRHRGAIVAVAAAPTAFAVAVIAVAQLSGAPLLRWIPTIGITETGLYLAALVALVIGLPVRYRTLAGAPERRAFLLVVGTVAVVAAMLVATWTVPAILTGSPLFPWPVYGLFGLPVPIALGIAILRFGVFDLKRMVNRSLVYGGASAAIALVYVLLLGGAFVTLQARFDFAAALVVTALVILIAQPIRDGLQRAVNRLMYGDRDDPSAGILRLAERLESSLRRPELLPEVAATVAGTLRLPYVAIELQQDGRQVIAAAQGEPVANPIALPLVDQGERVGRLLLAPRNGDDGFSETDRRLLSALATQVGAAARNVELDAALQRSREQLVAAREEERRRLRRDLHDGLGPTLAGNLLQLRAAKAALAKDPARASALIDGLEADTRQAIAEVRRMSRDLRPPALDDLGLVGALREQALQFSVDPELVIELEIPEELPSLPAAVEVAVYRIVLEALANVARHARARACRIEIAMRDSVEVSIADDGSGLAANQAAGVGLTSMRERAEELGGSFEIRARPGGGTVVEARLPMIAGALAR